jgi:RNA-directed DNA polymerase
VEGRRCRDTERLEGKRKETPGSPSISTKLEQIANLAKEAPDLAFTTLAHHLDIEWLREAYRRTRKDGAAGVDGQTADEYAAHLEDNLHALLERAKAGTYRAPPVRRVHLPKGQGAETRPIGIPTFEDKILQRAVAMVLEAVYEQDFLDGSYGFRPGRSAHQALETLRDEIMKRGGGWIVEVDIRRFFDTLDHRHLKAILRQRVRDGVLLRLRGKWLNAGVMEAGELSYPEAGTPQGGVVSPLLANVYLHHVLDAWFEREVKPRLRGRAVRLRYADDAVLLFACEHDARRVLDVLPKRFGTYGLALHPDKTRLVEFRRPRRPPPAEPRNGGAARSGPLDRPAPQPPAEPRNGGRGAGRPGTFDLLGFTHFWDLSRQGKWVVKRKTASRRFGRALRRIADWCRLPRHLPVEKQREMLAQKLRGHFGYFGIRGNSEAISRFRECVIGIWRKWLGRRSQRAYMDWDRMHKLLERYPLPTARIARPYSLA